MMSTTKRLVKAAGTTALCAFVLSLHGDAQAADSEVPLAWNVGPMTSGAYLESFDNVLPVWAGVVGFSTVTNDFPSMSTSGLPARSNAWFAANAKVLQLETDGDVVSNALAYVNSGDPVSFASQPVFVDLRMRFDPLVNPPDAGLLANSKMAIFLNSDAKLVVVHANGAETNATALEVENWYQVTVKLLNGKFDVLLNDELVFSGLSLKAVGGENTLANANFYGTGFVDELYVSHGDPAYVVPGPTTTIPDLPADGSNPPTDTEQTRINAWLSANSVATVGTLTQDQLSLAYLLDSVDGSTVTAVTSYDLGISKINLTSPTSVSVTALLKVDNAAVVGKINGRIQLLGKTTIGAASWTTLEGAITPQFADFTAGEATYVFTVPEGYQFFKPQIIP